MSSASFGIHLYLRLSLLFRSSFKSSRETQLAQFKSGVHIMGQSTEVAGSHDNSQEAMWLQAAVPESRGRSSGQSLSSLLLCLKERLQLFLESAKGKERKNRW